MGIPVLSEILSEIERLIIEHGSAAVLYERLAFAKEQYKATEQQLQESQAKNGELADENRQLRKENDELKRKVAELQSFSHCFGILWDQNGTPFCTHCQKSGLRIVWQTHIHQQIKSFKCSCSESPFVPLKVGEPVQAYEAMKLMAEK